MNFNDILRTTAEKLDIDISKQAEKGLCVYYEMLVAWNEKMNLTAITSPEDAALKHFSDSLMLLKTEDIPQGASLIDVGTGAGFPGMVLKIARRDIRLTLLDSLEKRLHFLEEVSRKLDLSDVRTVHARAEDGARDEALRDLFDVAASRAVARMNILCEYCLPYVKQGGVFLSMKGKEAPEELAEAQNALKELSGEVEAVHTFDLLDAGKRAVIRVRKTAPTPEKYPRTSKKIKTKPL